MTNKVIISVSLNFLYFFVDSLGVWQSLILSEISRGYKIIFNFVFKLGW